MMMTPLTCPNHRPRLDFRGLGKIKKKNFFLKKVPHMAKKKV